jgi:DNA polymerase-3 subunit delta'
VGFSRIYGHRRPIAVLQSAMGKDRVAAAYLFSGPPGVGKQSTAMEFIKALNCQTGNRDACDVCPSCRLIDKGEFPDLYVPDRQGNRIVKGSSGERGTNTLVNIVARLHYPPLMGTTKVVLLDPADRLTAEAGNMLLKILEEPPKATLFILVTTLEGGVLPTLVSRCQKLRFAPLAVADVAEFLQEQRSVPEDLARGLAAVSEGSIARALDLKEGKIMEQRLEVVDFLLALPFRGVAERVESSLLALATLGAKERLAAEHLGTIANMLARDLLTASVGMESQGLLFPERRDGTRRVASAMGRQGALGFSALVRDFARGLAHNENPKHLLYFLGNEMARLVSHGEDTARSHNA